MTIEEAIAHAKEQTEIFAGKHRVFLYLAIEALERQMPYKPKEYEDKYYSCKCGNTVMMKWEDYPVVLMPKSEGLPFCLGCGQALDWKVEE